MVLALAFAGLAVSPSTPVPVASAGNIISLIDYYPNTLHINEQQLSPVPKYATLYLLGENFINPGAPFPANIWTRWNKTTNVTTFQVHNAGPAGDPNPECSKDNLTWLTDARQGSKQGLYYSTTSWRCAPNFMSHVKYQSGGQPYGLRFLPLTWDDASVCSSDPTPSDGYACSWTAAGSIPVTYSEGTNSSNLTVKCTGTTNWIAQIHGYMQYAPGLWGIHWSTTQTTNWTGGPGANTGCAPGQVTNWREDYVFADGMPTWPQGSPAKGLKRHWGGNTNGVGNWDIWYHGYNQMPSWTTMPALPVP